MENSNQETGDTSTILHKSDVRNEIYWLHNVSQNNFLSTNNVTSFDHDDIVSAKLKPIHLNRLVRKKHGRTTTKQDNKAELNFIGELHEKVKISFKNEFIRSFEEVMVSVALEIGMRDGRSKFTYKDIAKHVLENPNYYTICRMTYLMRGIFERHHC